MKEKKHFPFFDSAYQGFASGDVDKDAFAVRHFVEQGFNMLVCQSYAKNFGLYAERIGAMNVVCPSAAAAENVVSQLNIITRPMLSSPPAHGARIVAAILNDPKLYNEWLHDLKTMAGRIVKMRELLYEELQRIRVPGDWSHIVKQIGMFSFTGLHAKQVEILTKKYHIYMLSNGRISMAGLSTKTVPYLAAAIKDAIATAKL
eukprot:TRINITY_DN3594_c0_g3_i3.p1 TRINITY_DN3594_c0_g3~~TRINITY_DN3594_c0_g3_i3.p1  ORF type:complete len:214 (+),score=18.55 TRINITY_DN3594_c0_g3_i3:36-644(+)